VVPEGLACEINLSSWDLPPVFRWLAKTANMSEPELLKTFNCGIGMIAFVDQSRAAELSALFRDQGETVVELGRVVKGEGVIYKGALL
jgi:phosphoribosylformylglycinamidine cyclo-ligase